MHDLYVNTKTLNENKGKNMNENKRNNSNETRPTIAAASSCNKCCHREDITSCSVCYYLQNSDCQVYTLRRYDNQQNICKILRRKRTNKIYASRGFGCLLRHRTPMTSLNILKYFFTWTFLLGPAIEFFLKSIFLCHCSSLGIPLTVAACRPGPTGNGAMRLRLGSDLHPFQKGEFVPKVSEQTIGASGPSEGPIYRDSQRYRENLKPNWNPDIIFRDEERTNEDRMMTERCMDKLNILSVLVMNQWPGVFLRVTEAWDDPEAQKSHSVDSLHFEGRAVDITTSDQDRNKYPVLARLAVEAEFDWVFYEKTHIHCSVKSPSFPASEYGGCFPGDSLVPLPGGGRKRMDELRVGDPVWSMDKSGKIVQDEILTFIDIQHDVHAGRTRNRMFISISTASKKNIRMTKNHLIFKEQKSYLRKNSTDALNLSHSINLNHENSHHSFAALVEPGESVYKVDYSNKLFNAFIRPDLVTNVEMLSSTSGAFAPLTGHGTIVVDDVVASCYAVVYSHKVAHVAMTPFRYYYVMQKWLNSWLWFPTQLHNNTTQQKIEFQLQPEQDEGVTYFAKILYKFGSNIIPSDLFWGD